MPWGDRVFHICNYTVLMLLNICMLYPIVYQLSVSISDPLMVERGMVWLLPKGFSMEAYKEILGDRLFLRSYLNTIIYSASAMVISLVLLCLTAYPLSVRELKWRGPITGFFAFTMFFGGGMIPTYLVIRGLGILNTIWAVILPGALGMWNIILCRTFFQNIPESLRESAMLDGASEVRILVSIVIPLSKALMAVMALYIVVGQWNSYFGPFIYLNDSEKYPLQVVLRSILNTGRTTTENAVTTYEDINKTLPQTLRAAALMVTIIPIMCVYPFLQKYFVKGVMIGSIKG